jgi:hypothetical protein
VLLLASKRRSRKRQRTRFKTADQHVSLQVLGEVAKRMACARDFPSRLMTVTCEPLHASLQPGVVRIEEPNAPFPRSGFYKDGIYYEAKGCGDNLVNVRPHFATLLYLRFMSQHLPSLDLDRQQLVVRAETKTGTWGMAAAFLSECAHPRGADDDGAAESARATVA